MQAAYRLLLGCHYTLGRGIGGEGRGGGEEKGEGNEI